MRRFFTIVIIGTLFIAFALWSGAIDIDWRSILQQIQRQAEDRVVTGPEGEKIRIVSEESVVIDVVEKVSPSVVTVGIVQDRPVFEYDPFDPFGFFQVPRQRSTQREEADIGSGFIVSGEGLIVTNRHVVDNADASYKIITADNSSYEVENVYRDPANDIAIIKINPSAGSGQALKPVEMGDSDSIKVGQLVIALGTPLGEFRGSATKGIVSGIGRGITAGSPFEGVAAQTDDIITHFGGQRVQREESIAQLVNKKKIGDRVVVRIWRDGEEKELTVQ